MLLIERKFGGVNTRQMFVQGTWCAGTTFVEFDNVKVPVENLIGPLGGGFKVLMCWCAKGEQGDLLPQLTVFLPRLTDNFNSERIGSISGAVFSARVAYSEALRYAHKRKTFGKYLIEHPVIRAKLANMARQIEAAQAWIELVVYQTQKFPNYSLMNDRIGGVTALMKGHGSQVCEYVLREASQIFGGLSYTRGGQGGKVERLYREGEEFERRAKKDIARVRC